MYTSFLYNKEIVKYEIHACIDMHIFIYIYTHIPTAGKEVFLFNKY